MERQRSDVHIQHSQCPYCKDAVRPDQEKLACDSCMAWHHEECWRDHGSCCACGANSFSGAESELEGGEGAARVVHHHHGAYSWRAEWTAQATGTGRKVSWRGLRQGQLVPRGYLSLGFTTVIPDAINAMIEACRAIDPKCALQLLKSNDMTSPVFLLEIEGAGFQVRCRRRLVRGWFPLNPFAAEFGSNYDVDFDIRASSKTLRGALSKKIEGQFPMVGQPKTRDPESSG